MIDYHYAIITKTQEIQHHNLDNFEYHHVINNWGPKGNGTYLFPNIPIMSTFQIEESSTIGISFVIVKKEKDAFGRSSPCEGVVLTLHYIDYLRLFRNNTIKMFFFMTDYYKLFFNKNKKNITKSEKFNRLNNLVENYSNKPIHNKKIQKINFDVLLSNLRTLDNMYKHINKKKRTTLISHSYQSKTQWYSEVLPILSILLVRGKMAKNKIVTFSTFSLGIREMESNLPTIMFTANESSKKIPKTYWNNYSSNENLQPDFRLLNND